MDFIFLHLQNFTVISYLAFAIVLASFFLEAKSNSPYKSLLFSNIGFAIYNFSLLACSDIDFPIYFILLSFLVCSWFFILKNIEEEEDEDRGYLRSEYNYNNAIDNFTAIEDEKSITICLPKRGYLYACTDGVSNQLKKLFETKIMLFGINFFKNDVVHYQHPQRKFVHSCTYLILIAILVSFFYV